MRKAVSVRNFTLGQRDCQARCFIRAERRVRPGDEASLDLHLLPHYNLCPTLTHFVRSARFAKQIELWDEPWKINPCLKISQIDSIKYSTNSVDAGNSPK